jgi:hypothetical protein
MTTPNEMTARATARYIIVPMKVKKDKAFEFYQDALKAYRKDYRDSYKLALGLTHGSDWDARLEEGFSRGIVSTRSTLHHAIADLSANEAQAHVKTADEFEVRKHSLTKLYRLYIFACSAYTKAFDDAYAKAYAPLEKQDDV